MKILPAAILALCMLSCSAPAPGPAHNAARQKLARLIARVAYAKAHADPAIYSEKGGDLGCSVYTVTQSADGAPGYSVVIATDQGFSPMDDMVLVCDTVAVDPAHSVKCTGHVIAYQGRWLITGSDDMSVTFGLGKHDGLVTITGSQITEPM